MSKEQLIQQALTRTNGNAVLAEALVEISAQFHTPVNDPLGDWQILTLGAVRKAVETKDAHGLVWRTIPETVQCRQFQAPAKQCVLAYGTRMVSGRTSPTPVAVIAWITRGDSGIVPVLGPLFYYTPGSDRSPARWFTNDQLDPYTRDAVEYYLNTVSGAAAGQNTISVVNRVGVDLEEEENAG